MAIQTADIIFVVNGLRKIHLLFAGRVAGQAAVVNCFRAGRLEAENIFRIARIIRVRRAGAVATFAALMGRAAAGVECGLEMRRFLEAVE